MKGLFRVRSGPFLASAHEPGPWHGAGIAPPLRSVRTATRGALAELHRHHRHQLSEFHQSGGKVCRCVALSPEFAFILKPIVSLAQVASLTPS
jgi:hypothetical protein